MQHTEILELNACIAYLRTGKEAPQKGSAASRYDMTWTFTAPRDPTITELYVGSPDDSAWLPTAADIKAEQQRRQKEKDDEARRATTPQPIQKPAANANPLTPVPLTGLRPPIEIKKRPVASRTVAVKPSLLTQELSSAKKSGGGGGTGLSAGQAANVPSVKFTIYLPDRRGIDIRIPKVATVEQAIAIILERSRDKLGKRKTARFELRMHDSDGLPDDDFPALDRSSILLEIGANEFCLCELKKAESDEDTSAEEEEVAVAAPIAVAPPPPLFPGAITRSKSMSEGKKILVLMEKVDKKQKSKTIHIEPGEEAQTFLRKILQKSQQFGLVFSEEYQLQVREEDREQLGMMTSVLFPTDIMSNIGTDTVVLCKRRYADAPPDVEYVDLIANKAGREARKGSDPKKLEPGANGGARLKEGAAAAGADKNNAVPGITIITTNEPLKREEGAAVTPGATQAKAPKSSTSKSLKKGAKDRNVVDSDSILLNEIKAAVYEEWPVIKTNNWGKHQNRTLGIDLQKIYNKPRIEGGGVVGFGQSVKHAERLIADVVSIDINPNNPQAFTIKVRDGPGNAVVVLNYDALEADVAARIVAKVKYIQSGMIPQRT